MKATRLPAVDRNIRSKRLAAARRALDLWLAWYGGGPHEVIPHVLRETTGLNDEDVEAISAAARRWVRHRGSFHESDAPAVLQLAGRGLAMNGNATPNATRNALASAAKSADLPGIPARTGDCPRCQAAFKRNAGGKP